MLSEIAIDNAAAFAELVTISKDALNGIEYKPTAVKLENIETTVKVESKEEVKEVKKATPKKAPAKKEVSEKKVATKKTTTKKTAAKKTTKKDAE
jgi:hypothetical protein